MKSQGHSDRPGYPSWSQDERDFHPEAACKQIKRPGWISRAINRIIGL
jgi:hypothetical protein